MDFFTNFDVVLSYAKQGQADLVIHGGDLFYRTLVPAPIVDRVYERINDFAQSGIPIVIVPGNHESSRLPVSLFMQHPNIHYYSKPQVFNFSLKGVDFDIAGFPCIRKEVESKFPEVVNEIQPHLRKESVKLLCMHQSIEGAKVGPSGYTFRKGNDVISIDALPADYNLILSGHIHRTQILWTKNETPILYPGSIEWTAFAEKGEDKGFYEIDFDDNMECTYRFVKLNTRPMVDVLLEKEVYSLATLKEDILYQIEDLPSDSIVRFKMNNTANLALLNVKLLDNIIPATMNYQVAGFRDSFASRPSKLS